MALSNSAAASGSAAICVNGSASGELLRNAGWPVRTQYSSSFQLSWMPMPENSITDARDEPGTSSRSISPRGVFAKRSPSCASNTPTLASRRSMRASADASVSVARASSRASRGPAASRSAIPSFAATNSARDT